MKLVRKKSGFTILNILIVLSVFGIFIVSAVPTYLQFIENAKKTVSIGALETVRAFMKNYVIDHGVYPARFNFSNCTDGYNRFILPPATCEQLKHELYSFSSYNSAGKSYELQAKAIDSAQTILRLTPGEIVAVAP